jgi:hypothetical protein
VKVGDLVNYYDGLNDDKRVGLVLEIISWRDAGAPDRNFGIDIKVLWSDGTRSLFAEDELRVVGESR